MRKRVLVVEGEARRRSAIRDALAACGLEVIESPGITEAIGRLKASDFDGLVVADELRQLALKGLCSLTRRDGGSAAIFVLLRPGSDRYRVSQAAGETAVLIPESTPLEDIAGQVIGHFGSGAPEMWKYAKTRAVHRSRLWEAHLAKSPGDEHDVLIAHISEQFAKDPDLRAEFLGPAEAARGVQHPNLPKVYDVGGNHDIPFVAYALAPGATLGELLKRRARGESRLTPAMAIHIAMQVAAPLNVAHEDSLVHGALNPHAVWISSEGEVRLYYLGFAGFLGVLERSMGSNLGMSVPDPYLAPEQLKNGPIDHRTDIFLLGLLLHDLLSGKPTFLRDRHQETAAAILNAPIQPPSGPGIPDDLSSLTMACLERNPAYRPSSAKEVLAELAKIEREHDPTSPRSAPRNGPTTAGEGAAAELARIVRNA